jgi:hypothetical protein
MIFTDPRFLMSTQGDPYFLIVIEKTKKTWELSVILLKKEEVIQNVRLKRY